MPFDTTFERLGPNRGRELIHFSAENPTIYAIGAIVSTGSLKLEIVYISSSSHVDERFPEYSYFSMSETCPAIVIQSPKLSDELFSGGAGYGDKIELDGRVDSLYHRAIQDPSRRHYGIT